MPSESPTFQTAVARLQQFWADQGCLVWQPHNVEVGAGTMNPATFLQVLGPEPWNVVYFEPSIRPDDARYGENPNRMGRHHQMQVILKPDPGDPQNLYLQSLQGLGVDLERHDIRFVEDNWESPALGAWGLGWEVWLDGLEITQFTYFQQAGSVDVDPVSVEITYGLDRILMALQDVMHFRDLQWSDRVSGAHVQVPMEVQTSRYYFDVADVGRLVQLYDLAEEEAQHAIASGLAYVAHDYLLKCSHVFNVLDARGAIGVTERARYFRRMRRIARAIAESYTKEREELGHPLLERQQNWVAGAPQSVAGLGAGTDQSQVPGEPSPEAPPLPESAADFLLEVGTEELPVADLDVAVEALTQRVPELLSELRLQHGAVSVLSTPRRLAVLVRDLAARQEDVQSQVVGPPLSAAYDESGAPTKAALGFAKAAGAEVDSLEVVERGGEERVAALKREAGRPAAEVLRGSLPELIGSIRFERSMRWNETARSFSRPVRWLVCLHGESVVPIEFAGVTAGRASRGLRISTAQELPLAAAGDYKKLMLTHAIVVDPVLRRAEVIRQVDERAAEVGGSVPDDPNLVTEVTNLVERPQAIRGEFEEEYLALPAPVLTTVMKKHQRYFPVVDESGSLTTSFIAVANGARLDVDAVRHGNEHVVRARFADAAYFWNRDTKRQLDDFTPLLSQLTFQSDLGSVFDKVRRLEALAPIVAKQIGADDRELELVARAAALCKSDLATEMVVDFTSLQGVMGREYASLSGEPTEVADALFEQYLPRGADDDLPQTVPGMALALSDRLDSIVGLFAVGAKPTGAADPFGLRRAALGIMSILTKRDLPLDIGTAVSDAATLQPVSVSDEVRTEVLTFMQRRLEGQLRDAGHAADAVAAVLAVQGDTPSAARRAIEDLERHVARDDWQTTLDAYSRSARIVRDRSDGRGDVDPAHFDRPTERVLYDALEAATEDLDREDLNAVLHALAALAPAIHTYFDEVLVMHEDPALRENRLSQVRKVAELPAFVADLSRLEGF